jgi:hypothetical protein
VRSLELGQWPAVPAGLRVRQGPSAFGSSADQRHRAPKAPDLRTTTRGERLRRSIRVLLVGTTLALAIAVMSPSAYADAGLKLHPNGFGEKSCAACKAQQGQSDTRGNARHALYFQKMTATSTFAAGIARTPDLRASRRPHLPPWSGSTAMTDTAVPERRAGMSF